MTDAKNPPETISFPAALPSLFHGIGAVCREADVLPEVIDDIFAKKDRRERQLGIGLPGKV